MYILITSQFQSDYIKKFYHEKHFIFPRETQGKIFPQLIPIPPTEGRCILYMSHKPEFYFKPEYKGDPILSFGQFCFQNNLHPYTFKIGDKVRFPLTKSYGKSLYECNTLKNLNPAVHHFILKKIDVVDNKYSLGLVGGFYESAYNFSYQDLVPWTESGLTSTFKIGQKVCIPQTKSKGVPYESSTTIRGARRMNQNFLYITNIECPDTVFLGPVRGEKGGDKFAYTDIKLYTDETPPISIEELEIIDRENLYTKSGESLKYPASFTMSFKCKKNHVTETTNNNYIVQPLIFENYELFRKTIHIRTGETIRPSEVSGRAGQITVDVRSQLHHGRVIQG
jgi:hypothetical protein